MLNWIKQNKFRSVLLIVLTALFIFLISTQNNNKAEASTQVNKEQLVKIFYAPGCIHCKHLDDFINSDLKDKYPTVYFEKLNISKESVRTIFAQYLSLAGLDPNMMGTPTIFIQEDYLMGFGSPETTGVELINLIEKHYFNGTEIKKKSDIKQLNNTEEVTFFGHKISLNKSLPIIAITLGLVDGFNPCAMWVLLYLISIMITLQDKKKMWLIVGTFVAAEAILYYAILNLWLGTFLFLGAIQIITLLIGIVAIYFGAMDLKQYFLKEDMICTVGNIESKNKTKNKIKKIADAEITIATIIGLIALAFVVNSMEFMCSAGIPAVFAKVLAQSNITEFMKQVYIIIYDFFFMIDDFIIFGLAIFAIDKFVTDKYMRISKLIGGAILVLLGIIMLFFPELLR